MRSSPASSSSTASSSSHSQPDARARLLLLTGEPGDELAASLYQAAFAASAVDATCELRTIGSDGLGDAVAAMRRDPGVIGAAVLMPHTVPIGRWLDGLGPEAQVIKAVNTVSHRAGALIGWNTDRTGSASLSRRPATNLRAGRLSFSEPAALPGPPSMRFGKPPQRSGFPAGTWMRRGPFARTCRFTPAALRPSALFHWWCAKSS